MRRSTTQLYKMPKNMGVAPRYDMWNEKYEPWEHMKRMGRLVGTGFYIPPEWYNHFRMFPPINHNFQQEKTLNPHNKSEPTQDAVDSLSAERIALRDELSRKSRLVASEGMRYYNIYWVRKPLDRLEKEYYDLKSKGVPHDVAIKKVLESFYTELAAKKRVAAIQAEEAKLSGKFISMREATVVMNVLTQLQREQLTPHQATALAKEQRGLANDGESLSATIVRTTTAGTAEAASPTGDEALSADALADMLAADDGGSAKTIYTVDVHETPYDSIRKLRELATDHTGKTDWYTGESPTVPVAGGSAASEKSAKSPEK